MNVEKLKIKLEVGDGSLDFIISGVASKDRVLEATDFLDNCEAQYQILEGCKYEYLLPSGFKLEQSNIISPSKFNPSSGNLEPGIYVGTLTIPVLNETGKKCSDLQLEVQSVKTNYRYDYRFMLQEIAEKSIDLMLSHSSPASQIFTVDYSSDAKTLYQRFAFIKSIIDSDDFRDSLSRILAYPSTRWKTKEILKDSRNVRRVNGKILKQFASSSNRIELSKSHHMSKVFASIPREIQFVEKKETVDTPENRFIKHALQIFQKFCTDIKSKFPINSRAQAEVENLSSQLEEQLSHSFFKEISEAKVLPLNSPTLQRKAGYREVLRAWLMFDLAAKLTWKGGEDVYSANKKDVAILYEYWIFFKLLDIVKNVFRIEVNSLEDLLQYTSDGMGLRLRQGKHLAIKGLYVQSDKSLNIEFSYNRTFLGDNEYPNSGSWSRHMRPDYTLSIWPDNLSAEEAEIREMITHIHFDSKYKIDNILQILGTAEDFDTEKTDQRTGTYKRVDLLKMHAYKDAIRRTAGTFIIYPGDDKPYLRKGFHEILPGIGAFAIRPSPNASGIEELQNFIGDVLDHCLDRTSQQQKMAEFTLQNYRLSRS